MKSIKNAIQISELATQNQKCIANFANQFLEIKFFTDRLSNFTQIGKYIFDNMTIPA